MPSFWRSRAARCLCACLLIAACRRATPLPGDASGGPAASPPPASRDSGVPRIVVLGDSLTAGLGLAPDEAYPAVLQKKLDDGGVKWEVVNAGVSGDTSAAGLQRIDWALDQE